jgi:hypothetical protein
LGACSCVRFNTPYERMSSSRAATSAAVMGTKPKGVRTLCAGYDTPTPLWSGSKCRQWQAPVSDRVIRINCCTWSR